MLRAIQLKQSVDMSEPVKQWIKSLPQVPDADLDRLLQAVAEEQRARFLNIQAKSTFQQFRRKCIQRGRELEDDQISDFSEDSPGEFAAAISQGIHKLVRTLQACREKRIQETFQKWKSTCDCKANRFQVSLKRSFDIISVD